MMDPRHSRLHQDLPDAAPRLAHSCSREYSPVRLAGSAEDLFRRQLRCRHSEQHPRIAHYAKSRVLEPSSFVQPNLQRIPSAHRNHKASLRHFGRLTRPAQSSLVAAAATLTPITPPMSPVARPSALEKVADCHLSSSSADPVPAARQFQDAALRSGQAPRQSLLRPSSADRVVVASCSGSAPRPYRSCGCCR